jgi:DNA-binding PadR family transcriptional regulator
VGLIENDWTIDQGSGSGYSEGKMDKLIKSLLETLNKEPMTPHQLAQKLEKNLGGIVTTLRFMSFEKWVAQDETTKILHLTPIGRTHLRNLKKGVEEQLS